MICDFHLHSTKSDGKLTPTQLVERSKTRGLACLAVTDHDTVDGVAEALAAGDDMGLQVLPGIEISSYDSFEVHVLAYNLDYASPALAADLQELKELRKVRNYAIVNKLAAYGIYVDLDKIYDQAEGKTIGRPDIADEMVKLDLIPSRFAAFDEYLGFGKKAYVQSVRLTPREAIELALKYNGVPVLAHPKNLKLSQPSVTDYILSLKGYGLAGIEADYYSHTDLERKFYRSLADKFKLIVTGGSDYHDGLHGGESVFHPNKLTRRILKIREI